MQFLNKALGNVLLVLFSGAFLFMLLEPFTDVGFVEPLSVVILAVGFFFGLRWIYRKLEEMTATRMKVLILIAFVLFIALQILVQSTMHVQVFGDPWHIHAQAVRMVAGDKTWDLWIQQYPNLVPLVGLDMILLQIADFLHINYFIVFYGFNILINTLLWGVTVKFLWNKKKEFAGLATLVILILPSSYSFLVNVGYSDGIAMLSLVFLVLIFDRANHKGKLSILQMFFVAATFTFAYMTRPNTVILFIALFIIGIYTYTQRKKYGKLWKICLQFFLACVVGIVISTLASRGIAHLLHYDLHNSYVFPVWNWIYEGLNLSSVGQYTRADRYYTLNHTGFATAAAADKAGIVWRLQHYGVHLPSLWLGKFTTLWSCGTFATGTDYTVPSWTYNWSYAPGWLIHNIGAIGIFSQVYSKALVAVLLFAIVYSLWKKKKDLMSSYGFVLLIIIGITLFHTLLWEVKPRYQFMTFALLIIAAVWSSKDIFSKAAEFKVSDKSKKILKIALPLLAVISLGLMGTVMQSQSSQKIIVNTQAHPTNDFGYTYNDVMLKEGEQLSQQFDLSTAANRIDWQTATSGPLNIKIVKINADGSDKVMDSRTLITYGTASGTTSQKIYVDLPAGHYRFLLTNDTPKEVMVDAMTSMKDLDYPHMIDYQDGRKGSFEFSIVNTHNVSRYPVGFIVTMAILFILIYLAIFKFLL